MRRESERRAGKGGERGGEEERRYRKKAERRTKQRRSILTLSRIPRVTTMVRSRHWRGDERRKGRGRGRS
eukprot:230334-Hanusia_phi.AAC.1